MSMEFPNFNSIESKVQDAANQLMHFKFLKTIEEAHVAIREANLQYLEEYIGEKTTQIEMKKPGVCTIYNALVDRLKSPDLTLEEIKEISEKVYLITR